MNNAYKPINPIFNNNGFITHESHIKDSSLIGLSKREYFAGLAMQGILFNPPYGHIDCKSGKDLKDIVKLSVDYADELLKQLENN